ncbi:NINE protein [Paenibacillus sp. NPDC058174]|uniref:NINE protein n=1 Tax=Paenibacillus sp. NPDC058174 TaxID=3346366 RepID=UPI0036DBF444
MNRSDLTLNELLVFNSEMKNVEKSAAIAYLMLIGGHLGVHRFYLKKKVSAIIQLVLFLLASGGYIFFGFMTAFIDEGIGSVALFVVSLVLFLVPAIALLIWIIVDLCLISRMVREYNSVLEHQLVEQIIHHRTQQQQQQF